MKILYHLVRDFNEDRWWCYYEKSRKTKNVILRNIYTFLFMRMAAKNGGYVGPQVSILGKPDFKHDFHGIHINRNAIIGKNCQIGPNVIIGSRGGRPRQ